VSGLSWCSLDAVTRREQSLGLFHALGKVFYNKRMSRAPSITQKTLIPDYIGLGDPNIESEDQEDLAAIRGLPPEDALPAHLADFKREKSMNQMEVSSTLCSRPVFSVDEPADVSTYSSCRCILFCTLDSPILAFFLYGGGSSLARLGRFMRCGQYANG
jgi:hypothetical protein